MAAASGHLHYRLEFESCHDTRHFCILLGAVAQLAVGTPSVAEYLAFLCTTDNWSAGRERERLRYQTVARYGSSRTPHPQFVGV
jgi:hypothetical protein